MKLRPPLPSPSFVPRRSGPRPTLRAVLALALLAGALACSGGEPSDADSAPAGPAGKASVRWNDARVDSLREALADGWADVAEELLNEVGQKSELGLEAPLLWARLESLRGDPIAASQHIERARAMDPNDPRVWATAAEIAVAQGSFETALSEIKAGKSRCGETPEILRAEGVFVIFQPGLRNGKQGLNLLQRALESDPDLPFIDWPLSEAYRLYAQSLSATRVKEAIEAAESAVRYSAENMEARELLGDLYMLDHRWGAGITLFEGLLAEGRPLESKVALFSKQAGVVALQQGHQDLARQYFKRSRELGMSEADLGTGAMILKRAASEAVALAEAQRHQDAAEMEAHLVEAEGYWPDSPELRSLRCDLFVDQGIFEMSEGRLAQSREALEQALVWDDQSLMARHLLGRVCMDLGDYAAASAAWHRVVDTARELHIPLPDPVHLDLARALALQNEPDQARAVLQNYLDFEPSGEFVEGTRALLHELDSK